MTPADRGRTFPSAEAIMEQTLILLKPDAVARRFIGQIIERFERKGLRIVGMKMLRVSAELAGRMYAEHEGKDFYAPLMEFVTAGPLVAMVLAGKDVVAVARKLIGPTFGPDAPGGTIRGDFGMSKRYNLIHGSDSPQSARREIPLFFDTGELMKGDWPTDRWVYATQDGELL